MSDYMPKDVHKSMDDLNNGQLPNESNEVAKFASWAMSGMGVKPGSYEARIGVQLTAAIAAFVAENYAWLGTRDLPRDS